MLTVNEIFYSIQGESTFAGQPCVLIRLTGCDLRCSWCDTSYSFFEGRKISIDEVVKEVVGYGCSLVEITGGEPLLQEDVYPLMDRLLGERKTVLIETGGHLTVERIPVAVVKVIDIKCPGSGEADRNDWDNLHRLTAQDQVKFVIRDRTDYEYAKGTLKECDLDNRCAVTLFSPVYGVLDPKTLAAWILEDGLPVRIQIQLHKYIWGSEARGV